MEFLHIADQYYVLATSDLAAPHMRVLKQGELFAVFDTYGDIQRVVHSQSGIFYQGTRYVSRQELFLEGGRPLLLHSTLRDDNGVLIVDMTNKDIQSKNSGFIPRGTLHLHREKFLLRGRFYEKVTICNFGSQDIDTEISLHIGCDFADIFEVRGTRRAAHGKIEPYRRSGHIIYAPYKGLDDVQRTTAISFSAEEFEFDKGVIHCPLRVPKQQKVEVQMIISFLQAEELSPPLSYKEALESVRLDHESGRKHYCEIHTSNDEFNGWLRRSADDLIMMTTKMPDGSFYPYAGIPWYCCPFGRDGILTALELVWANPSLAMGVLEFLSTTQATSHEAARDSDPGKILHEAREGEMAKLNEIPFGRYYGSVDSTPLFVVLGGAYLTRTNDIDLMRKLWPHFVKALEWMDKYGDLDGDGFVEYQRESKNGLVNQGWKDSDDSVFHADGGDVRGPIALCEVQAYAYLAHLEGAKIAAHLGEHSFAQKHNEAARRLREKFDAAFWLEDLGTFALALDGNKKPCRVKSSNAGQCLFTGIVKKERVDRLVHTLMAPDSFSGWGIRTIATGSARYNPMSYHNGSVWPHDVSLIAWGMSRYGYKREVSELFEGLFRAATYMEIQRIPEVFCGFVRREGEGPTLYPHACSPQAWSAAAVYLLLQALLGLSIHAKDKRIHLEKPYLPDCIDTLKIFDLNVNGTKIDLIVQNYRDDVSVQVANRDTGIKVTVEK